MNNLGKLSVVMIAIFVAGNSIYPVSQLVNAQLDILETPTNPNNTSTTTQRQQLQKPWTLIKMQR